MVRGQAYRRWSGGRPIGGGPGVGLGGGPGVGL